MGLLLSGGVLAAAAAVFYANLPTRITLGSVVPTVDYLSGTVLKKLEAGKDAQSALAGPDVKAGDLFRSSPVLVMAVRRPGCALCRSQAKQLCGAHSQLAAKGVSVVGIVHETLGVDQFRPFLGCADAIYYDQEKRFFGPEQRWLPIWMGFLRASTYINLYKTKKAGVAGNTEGEGRLLGGVYLVNKDKMLFAHLESEWGDEASVEQILSAIEKMTGMT